MKSKLFLIYFLNLVSFMIQRISHNNNCYSNNLEPSEKKCKNVFTFKPEFCYMDYIDYSPEIINYESYIRETELNDEKLITYDNISGNKFNDKLEQKIIESENKENINIYNENNKENSETVYEYCEIGVSNYDIDEEQCLNSLISPKNNSNNKKCCFIEVNLEENDKIIWKNCLPISGENFKDNKYLSSLIPKFNEPTIARINCNDFYYIKRIPASEMSQCESVVNPSSKEQCNNIMFLHSECCYTVTEYDSKVIKECGEYNQDIINLEYDYKKYMKLDLINKKLLKEKNITDYNVIIAELNSEIPKSKTIYCKSFTKSIDYSTIKITKKDIIIAQKDGFCPNIVEDINIDNCFTGLLFSDFVSEGGQCCYLEIKPLEKGNTQNQCIPLTKFSRENNYLIKIYIDKYKPQGEYTALIVCDEYKAKYNSLTRKWIVSSDEWDN